MSETIYQAEPLYSRYDVPYVLPAVLDALRARRVNTAAINTSHVLFTVCAQHRISCVRLSAMRPRAASLFFHALPCCVSRLHHVATKEGKVMSCNGTQ